MHEKNSVHTFFRMNELYINFMNAFIDSFEHNFEFIKVEKFLSMKNS